VSKFYKWIKISHKHGSYGELGYYLDESGRDFWGMKQLENCDHDKDVYAKINGSEIELEDGYVDSSLNNEET
jgi:hypothetical protein